METFTCFITKKEFPLDELDSFESIKTSILKLIQTDYPGFKSGDYIHHEQLKKYRKKYLVSLIKKEHRDLNKLETQVLKAVETNTLLSDNIEPDIEQTHTFGDRIADKIAEFGGSWTFIISFFVLLAIWISANVLLLSKAFDPYPFILMNLILSCLAAIQAPIIMMSQNRKEQKDRARSEHDYMINLKAELEIRLLHEKIDHILIHQNKRLLDIQEIQLDYLEELATKK